MNRRTFRARRGYTLIEVATSVVIVAALTAAVLPVVVKQIDTAEPTRLASDLNAIGKAIENFHMNVRPRYPADLYQLNVQLTTSSTQSGFLAEGATWVAKDTISWKGPYLSSNIRQLNDSTLKTAFSATIYGRLVLIDSDAAFNYVHTSTTTNPRDAGTAYADADYIGLKIGNMTTQDFDQADLVIDGLANSSTGRLRFDGTFVWYLATPLSR